MADQKGRWASIWQMLCCITDKDAAPDPQQEQLCNVLDYSDQENIPDQPVQSTPPKGVSQITNLPNWEDREVMYKKRIHDLEQEVTAVLKTQKALSLQLYEMGCLAFPEMDPCDSTSPSFVEKLKVYLECLQLERQQLEKRVLSAEQTMWEAENELSDLEQLLHNPGFRGMSCLDRFFMPDSVSPSSPFSAQPLRHLFSKMHRRSPEKKEEAQSPGKWAEQTFGEVAPRKRSPVSEMLAKLPWRSPSKQEATEAKTCVPLVKRDIFSQHRLPQIFPHFGADSFWPPAEHSRRSPARVSVGHGDTCVAQVHGHWDPLPERVQEGLTRLAEDDGLNAAGSLPVATLSAGGSEDIRVFPHASVSQDISPTLQKSKMENCNIWSEIQHLPTVEGHCGSKRQGEGATSTGEECVPLGGVSLEPVGLAGQASENLRDALTDPRKLDSPGASVFPDLSGNAALQTEVSLPGKDSLKLCQSQSTNTVQSSNQAADLEQGTSQAALVEQASYSLDRLQKPEKELSSPELTLRPDLPSSSTQAPETHKPLGEKREPEEAPGLDNKTHQPVPMEENPAVAFPPQLSPEELLLSDLCKALTSLPLKPPQPTSLTEESPSSLAEETGVEGN